MPADEPEAASPVRIYVSGDKGYVWYPEEYKNQNVINGLPMELNADEVTLALRKGAPANDSRTSNQQPGLPMELNADEVTLALRKGWAVLQPLSLDAKTPAVANAAAAPKPLKQATTSGRQWEEQLNGGYTCEQYYSYYESIGAYHQGCDVQADLQGSKKAPGLEMAQQEGTKFGAEQSSKKAPGLKYDDTDVEPGWSSAVSDGVAFVLPVTATEAETIPGAGLRAAASSCKWNHPANPKEKLRYVVFAHLHSNGYTLSGGAKFGADLLAYPGDPSAADAARKPYQPDVVEISRARLACSQEAFAACHSASVPQTRSLNADAENTVQLYNEDVALEDLQPSFISIAPESGFGSRA
eukprot:gene22139-29201_t